MYVMQFCLWKSFGSPSHSRSSPLLLARMGPCTPCMSCSSACGNHLALPSPSQTILQKCCDEATSSYHWYGQNDVPQSLLPSRTGYPREPLHPPQGCTAPAAYS